MITYSIPEYKFEALEKQLVSLQKKIQKLGQAFAWEVGEVFTKTYKDDEGRDCYENFIPVTFEPIKYFHPAKDGSVWELCAQLEHTSAGNITYKISPEVAIPQQYHNTDSYCDECKKAIVRNFTYIVKNGETYKQVGGQCVKSYTGLDPNKLALMASIESVVKGFSDEDADFSFGRGGIAVANINQFMTIVTAIAMTEGWVSGKRAREEYCSPTSELAWVMYWDNDTTKSGLDKLHRHERWDDWCAFADEAIKWASELSDEAVGTNEWLQSIRVISKIEGVTLKRAGTAASIFVGYQTHKNNEILQKAAKDKPESKFVKRPGEFLYLKADKKNPQEATLRLTFEWTFQSDFGSFTLQLFEDEQGNVFKYSGGSPILCNHGEILDKNKVFIRGHVMYEDKRLGKKTAQNVIGWRKGTLIQPKN